MFKHNISCLAKVALVLGFAAVSSFAWPFGGGKDEDSAKDSAKYEKVKELEREIDALERMRMKKADELEKKEAEHWRKRYAESKLSEDHQSSSREQDSRYSKLSTDLGRVNEELMASKDVTTESEDKAKTEEITYSALNTQVKLAIEKVLGEATGDFPVGLEERLLRLRKAQDDADKEQTLNAMKNYLGDLLLRHEKTFTQVLEIRNSQVGSRVDVQVDRLRLGTVFLGEVAKDNGDVQALIRTGALQGKIFEWNSTLPPEMVKSIQGAVMKSKSESIVEVPLDILQNKAVKNAISETKETSVTEDLQAFFKKGGLVMYPLLLAAIFALLLCIERFFVLMRRGRIGKKFMEKISSLVASEKYEEAANLCLKHDTSLSMILYSILNKAGDTRDSAEKALQEALLREQPKLERRMGLLAAMGSIAPLLGLLGTVTGIITLFTVITEVGTNDARVLAGGISEALVTTETGLVIAIPVMILHGLLSERIEKVQSELYVQSTALLNKIFPKGNV